MTTHLGSQVRSQPSTPHSDLQGLLLTQKTELVGELAQAMANQFNNIMMAVTGYAEMELKKAGPKGRHGLEQVLAHAQRATSLIQKLLDFSRKRPACPQSIDVDSVIVESSALLKDLLGEHSELVLSLNAEAASITADRVELEQTLFTLIVIARDAMPRDRKVTISTSLLDLDEDFIGTENRAKPGKYLALCIENAAAETAHASSDVTLNQTEASNLFLAAVRGIVKNSDGLVRISREAGLAGSYTLYFPASVEECALDDSWPGERAVAARTILVVEDDDAVRIPAAEFLMMEGFKVLQARTGGEALNVAQQSRSAIDILITDIFMPKMSGHEVAAALLAQHPDLKVLFMSGDPTRISLDGSNTVPQNAILRKPFRLNALRNTIHDLLDS